MKSLKNFLSQRVFSKMFLGVSVLGFLFFLMLFWAMRPDLVLTLKNNYIAVSYDNETKTVSFDLTDQKPKNWVSLDEVSELASWAVVISEDWAFYEHAGVDFRQVQKAIKERLKGERLRGASTLTQQLAKNLFLSHERSFVRKIREASMALLIEQTLPKDQILEHYLNVVEFGEGVYGIAMASKFYFNKTPSELNAKEGAFLAMLLPSPKKYAESFEQKEMTDYAQQTVRDILEKMNQAKIIDDQQFQKELARILPFLKPQAPKKSVFKQNNRPSRQDSVKPKDFTDGKDFEKRYMNDPDLALGEVEEFDPSDLDEIDAETDVEFSLE